MSFQLPMNAPWKNPKGETLTRVNTGTSHVLTWRSSEGETLEELVLWMGLYTCTEMARYEGSLISRFMGND